MTTLADRTAADDGIAIAANRRRWDARARIHVEDRSGFYGVQDFIDGRVRLEGVDLDLLGSVEGLRVAHLQCHFGLDTLTLARMGAKAEGLDFSPVAIAAARRLAERTGLDAVFHEAEIGKAAEVMGAARFDLVYVTWGTICWLPDIALWARQVAALLTPGGRLHFQDFHPMAQSMELTARGLVPAYDWFTPRDHPLRFEEPTTYTGDPANLPVEPEYEWIHPVSAILNALIAAGLRIEALAESEHLVWDAWTGLTRKGEDGLWRLPEGHARIPLSLTVSASKPA